MPTTGGNYTLPLVYLAEPGTTIRAEQHNTPLEDIAQGLSDRLMRDGTAPMLANLPMNGRRVTNMADGVNPGDAATIGQATQARLPVGGTIGQVLSKASAVDFAAAWTTPPVVQDNATRAEAEAGTLNTVNMTPLRAEQHMEANALGWGQAWANVAASRAANTSYQNTTGRPIQVNVRPDVFGVFNLQVSINGTTWVTVASSGNEEFYMLTAIVPDTHYYRYTGSFGLWTELR